MPLVLGIDEAGYGPLLGPLTLAGTLWRVDRDPQDVDFWARLAASVARPGQAGNRLPVGDSKEVFDRKRGLAGLERPVLAFSRAAGLSWQDLREWLGALQCDTVMLAAAAPWYAALDTRLPRDPVRGEFEGAARRLADDMAANHCTCIAARLEIIPERLFNQRVSAVRNKAGVLMEAVMRLLRWGTEQAGRGDLYAFVDRQGGRADYRTQLTPVFPERAMHVEQVSDERSAYRLATQDSDLRVSFVVSADQRYLPVALASMFAKYARELLMERFNAFWRALEPALRPTAGYYTDALRFLEDIKPCLPRAGLRPEQFVRSR